MPKPSNGSTPVGATLVVLSPYATQIAAYRTTFAAVPTALTTGGLNTARQNHTATLLPSGNVLVTGGAGGGSSAELYDPATSTWTATGSLGTARNRQTATSRVRFPRRIYRRLSIH